MPRPPRRRPTPPSGVAPAVRRARERGSAGLELAIVTPVLFVLLGTTVQVGLWYHARAIALSAAQEGVRAARVPAVDQPTADLAGEQHAQRYLDQLGSDLLVPGSVRITPERGAASARAVALGGIGDVVSIRVQADVLSIVPGLSLSVDQVSTVTVERFRGAQETAP